jgi:adenine-specific DNA-methyltransferase
MKKQKLELTWIGKDVRPKLEPRILLEDPNKSYHAKHRVSESDLFDNRLIYGDNLLALKSLEQEFSGKIKCVYIDPPFNTGAMFDHYDDGIEHSLWLQQMRDRLLILHRLLDSSGVLWAHIDDKEMAYLRVLCDEVFGRKNFLNMIVVKTSDPSGHKTVNPSPYSQTEYILMYAKDRTKYRYEQRYVESSYDSGYNRLVLNRNAPFSEWTVVGLNEHVAKQLNFDDTRSARKKLGRLGFDALVAQFALENCDAVFQPTAISNVAGRYIVEVRDQSASSPDIVFHVAREEYEDIYVLNGRQMYFYSSKVREINGERSPAKPLTNLWTDIPYNGIAREGAVEFKNGKKPERLLERCIDISTGVGDWVLDSFAGSGTTGAVAHKMGRRWIMVELGEHCHTHVIPRLKRVVDGTDSAGVTEETGWQGGGGFRYFSLAPSLLEKDRWGNWVVNKEYNAEMLTAAICKLEGFTYSPSDTRYWQHGLSTETDFIYVTTQTLNADQLQALSDDVGGEKSLLVCCSAFKGDANRYPNLTLKKIPKMVLTKCEWGHDDYSLNVENLPMQQQPAAEPVPSKRAASAKAVQTAQDGLFDETATATPANTEVKS